MDSKAGENNHAANAAGPPHSIVTLLVVAPDTDIAFAVVSQAVPHCSTSFQKLQPNHLPFRRRRMPRIIVTSGSFVAISAAPIVIGVPPGLNRDFHFAFRTAGNLHPFASARHFFLHSFQGQRPGRARQGLCRDQKAMIYRISKRFLGHPSLNSPPSSSLVSPSCRASPAGSGILPEI